MVKKKSFFITVGVILALIIALSITFGVVFNSLGEIKVDYMKSENLAKSAEINANSDKLGASNVVDDNLHSYWAGSRSNGYITFDFKKEIEFNTVIINEIGFNVRKFSLSISNDGEKFETIYTQEHIEMQRVCALKDNTSARYLRLTILESDSVPKISNIAVHNEERVQNNEFDVVGYYILNSHMKYTYDLLKNGDITSEGVINDFDEVYKVFDGDKYDVYNTINMIAGFGWNENADLYFNNYNIEEYNSNDYELTQSKYEELFALMLNVLRQVIGDRDVRINITMGNPDNDDICAASMSGDKKVKLAKNMADFVDKYDLDGIDIDWEYPITQAHFDAYNAFLQELDKQLEIVNPDIEISLAVSTWAFRYTKETIAVLDRIQLMGYDIVDHNGDHGGFYGGAIQAVEYCLSQGFKLEQINLGMGFYGTHQEGKMEQYGYNGIASEDIDWFKNIYTVNGVSDIYFNGGQIVYDKTTYAIYRGLGGVMVWQMGSDRFGAGEDTLCYAMGLAVQNNLVGGAK